LAGGSSTETAVPARIAGVEPTEAPPTPPPSRHSSIGPTLAAQLAAQFEGASALAAQSYVIPPPRWLAGRRPAFVTARQGGLGYRTDPYAK
jgi:hypothetical protein